MTKIVNEGGETSPSGSAFNRLDAGSPPQPPSPSEFPGPKPWSSPRAFFFLSAARSISPDPVRLNLRRGMTIRRGG